MNIERAKERLDKIQVKDAPTYCGIPVEQFSKFYLLKILDITIKELIRERALYPQKETAHFKQEITDIMGNIK